MYTVDANVFLRDLDPRHPDTLVCRTFLERLHHTATPIRVPMLILAEVAGALSRELRDPMRGRTAALVVRDLPHLTLIPLDEHMAQLAAELAADCALRGADAVYVAVAYHHGTTLVSLDREVRERAARVVTTASPADVLTQLP